MTFYDGPVIPAAEGVIPHVIDDMIVCEDCLEEAGRLVGLSRASKLEEKVASMKAERDDAKAKLRGLEDYLAALEAEREERDKAIPLLTGRTFPARKVTRKAAAR